MTRFTMLCSDTPVLSIAVGACVRVYYDQETYDEGEVTIVTDGQIVIDFYDWIEHWGSTAEFAMVDLYYEAKQVLVPITDGKIIADFRSSYDRS